MIHFHTLVGFWEGTLWETDLIKANNPFPI